ncbi:o-succinylbenzoate synthase [Nesterenkonia cremea]|uniref:o-succinylbenzoate synthase n=1 Tax=Nesterenkonia cremea TaxID=1882340 RepID=A0A917ER46_9MICC|nr:o-succinylbenzoate synthase [Nesterenkonia cremea]GGE68794.1 o-succinylbenzoate synthase [Nesterenkonia cremea]
MWQQADPDEILQRAWTVGLPMRTRFRGVTLREAMLIQGPAGWGEFAPFPEYGAEESAAWLEAGLEAAWSGLGEPLRREIPVNATMPAVGPEQVEQVLRRFGELEAIPAVKIKVAEPGVGSFEESLAKDLVRVREVRRLVPQAGLRVDANGGWTQEQALRALDALAEVAGESFEYAEQPVAGVDTLAQLREELARRGVGIAGNPLRIAADEAVRKAEDPLRVARLGAADLIVVKVPPLGGVTRALRIVEESGLDAVASSALDTSVGLSAGLALAARLPKLPYACGLGTAALFEQDVVEQPLIPAGGVLPVPGATRAGEAEAGQAEAARMTAPSPSSSLLEAHRLPADREAWWRSRLREAHHALTGAARI